MKRKTPDHPKLLALAAKLGIPKYAAVGVLESLWHFTADYAKDGAVGRWRDAIAQAIGWDRASLDLIDGLVATGWLDDDPERGLIVHDWHEHADDAVHMALARGGQLFASGHRPKTGRLGRQDRERAEKLLDVAESTIPRQTHGVCTENARRAHCQSQSQSQSPTSTSNGRAHAAVSDEMRTALLDAGCAADQVASAAAEAKDPEHVRRIAVYAQSKGLGFGWIRQQLKHDDRQAVLAECQTERSRIGDVFAGAGLEETS